MHIKPLTNSWLQGICTVFVAISLYVPLPIMAQTPASILPPKPIDPFDVEVIVDFREKMREFVTTIGSQARTVNPNFVIVAENGLALVDKADPNDDTNLFPARTYMRAISGVLETKMLNENVLGPQGKLLPSLEDALKIRKTNEKTANDFSLPILNLEYSKEPATIDKLYQASVKKGYTPFVGENETLSSKPKQPKTAFHANPRSIRAISDIRNFLYVKSSQAFGNKNEYLQSLRATNYDALIIDVFHNGNPLTRQDIGLLKYKNLGTRRLVLAEMDISSAATFHYYWGNDWKQGNPPYIYTPIRNDPDRHHAIYWDAGWQAIITGNVKSYLYGILDLGFDGVLLKGVDAWKFYEKGGDTP